MFIGICEHWQPGAPEAVICVMGVGPSDVQSARVKIAVPHDLGGIDSALRDGVQNSVPSPMA